MKVPFLELLESGGGWDGVHLFNGILSCLPLGRGRNATGKGAGLGSSYLVRGITYD